MTQEIGGRMDLDATSIMVDAARWRALVGCERLRVLGGAGLGTPDALLGIELYLRDAWRDSATVKKLHADAVAELTAFADHARRLQAASLRASVTCASCSRPMEEHGPPHVWDTQQLPSCPPPSLTGTWRAPDTAVTQSAENEPDAPESEHARFVRYARVLAPLYPEGSEVRWVLERAAAMSTEGCRWRGGAPMRACTYQAGHSGLCSFE